MKISLTLFLIACTISSLAQSYENESWVDDVILSVKAIDAETNLPISDKVNGYLISVEEGVFDTIKFSSSTAGFLNVESDFSFPAVSKGNYLLVVESTIPLSNADGKRNPDAKYIPTFYEAAYEWYNADTFSLANDTFIVLEMLPVPPAGDGDATAHFTLHYEGFVHKATGVDNRERASAVRCGLSKRTFGGRSDQSGTYELIALGETNENGIVEFESLQQGTYRFFVQSLIGNQGSDFVEFELGAIPLSGLTYDFSVTLTASGLELEFISGVEDALSISTLYPNPSTDYILVEFHQEHMQPLTMEIIDVKGAMVERFLLNRSGKKQKFDVSSLPAGQFIVQLLAEGEVVQIQRLMKK